jgi:hypothetical protein
VVEALATSPARAIRRLGSLMRCGQVVEGAEAPNPDQDVTGVTGISRGDRARIARTVRRNGLTTTV